jgi:hypothetical protein
MTDEEQLQEFTQQVYLTINARRLASITDTTGVEAVAMATIWANLLLDELEMERNPDGTPVNWNFLRENDAEIGTITTATDTFDLPDEALRLVAEEERPLIIMQDSSIVSVWDVVDPDQITNRRYQTARDQRVTYVNQKIVFSRPLNETEIGGTIFADIVNSFPRLVSETPVNVDVFDLPIPRQLLVLGTAKNSSLPNIVKGGLSPSFAQKYSDLLDGLKMANMQTSVADEAVTDDFSFIGGV